MLEALLLDEVASLVERTSGKPLPDALAVVADALSDNPMLATLTRVEPATLAGLGRIDATAPGWQVARAAVDAALAADGRGGGELVLRWLASFVLTPARPATIAADLAVLIVALPDVPIVPSASVQLPA